jgi:oligopeptide transport system permease protein
MTSRDKKDQQVNEFNQAFKPISLWADAWRRLRRNRMALASLWVVGFYVLVSLIAPLLTSWGVIYDYTGQTLTHASLQPSFRPAGEIALGRIEVRIAELEKAIAERGSSKEGSGYSASTGFSFGTPTNDDGTPVTGEAAVSAPAAAENTTTNPGYGDLLDNELAQKKAEYASMKAEVENNPVNKRVYIFGTDDLGRDMLARAIYGGRISIMIGLVGAITAVFIGIIVGSIAGYIGGSLDNLLMRFVDIMYGLPYMLVVIIIMSIVGSTGRSSFIVLFIAIALVSWLTIARVVRGQILSLKNSEFVEAARSMGASTTRIIFRHLLPNTLGVIIVFTTLLIPGFIMNESFLSFLGLGISAPDASWGTLVAEGVRGMQLRPWQLLVPAFSMTIFLFCMNFLGDGLRDALDPQSKNRA